MNYLKALFIAAVAHLEPIHTMLVTMFILIAVDTATGIWAAVKRGEGIVSAGLRRTVTKALVYTMAVICTYLCQTYLMANIMPLASIAASAVGIVELKSILENADSIIGGDLFKSLIEKLGSVNDKKDK